MNAVIITVIAGVVSVLLLLIDRALVSHMARKAVEKILKGNVKTDPRSLENPKYGSVLGDGDRLRFLGPQGDSSELLWNEVEEVHAFKRDLLTTDLICLALKKSGKDEYYEINEEMVGYHDLLALIPRHLPKFNLNWFPDVAFPAFDPNHRVIWKRAEIETPA